MREPNTDIIGLNEGLGVGHPVGFEPQSQVDIDISESLHVSVSECELVAFGSGRADSREVAWGPLKRDT